MIAALAYFVEVLFSVIAAALGLAISLTIVARIGTLLIKRRLLSLPLSDTDRDLVEHWEDFGPAERGAILELLEQRHGKIFK